MVLTCSGLRHFALHCLQSNVLFHWLRELVLFPPDSRHRTPVHINTTVLHYSYMCGWKLSGITFNWLLYCSGLNLSKWSQQLCICKYLISIMYLCHLQWLMYVYTKYVLKWFMSLTFDNCVKWFWPTLGWGTVHCVSRKYTASLVGSQYSTTYSLAP